MCRLQVFERNSILRFSMEYPPLLVNVLSKSFCAWFCKKDSESTYNIQVEQPRDLARDSGQRKLTYSLQNHCASSRSVYLSRRLDSHWDKFAVTHHLKEVGVFSTEIKIKHRETPYINLHYLKNEERLHPREEDNLLSYWPGHNPTKYFNECGFIYGVSLCFSIV